MTLIWMTGAAAAGQPLSTDETIGVSSAPGGKLPVSFPRRVGQGIDGNSSKAEMRRSFTVR